MNNIRPRLSMLEIKMLISSLNSRQHTSSNKKRYERLMNKLKYFDDKNEAELKIKQNEYAKNYLKRKRGVCYKCGQPAGKFKVTICDECIKKSNKVRT